MANGVISNTVADFSTYTSTYGVSTFDLHAPQRYSFPPLPGTKRAIDQTINSVIATSTTDFRSVSPTANPFIFNFRSPLQYNFSPPSVSNENPIWIDYSRHEAQMSTGNNRYRLLTNSIANSSAFTSEELVTNHTSTTIIGQTHNHTNNNAITFSTMNKVKSSTTLPVIRPLPSIIV